MYQRTMTPREIVRKTLRFSGPPRTPRQLWFLPWAEEHYPRELARIRREYPDDLVTAPRLSRHGRDLSDPPERHALGRYTDEWGCVFDNAQSGIIGQVHRPLIADWDDLGRLKTPESYLDLDWAAVDDFCRKEERFVLAAAWLRPFERLQFLRSTENLMLDLAEQPPELFELLGRVHDFYLREAEAWARTGVDALTIMDDWGGQRSLLISPALWRRVFKPLYRDYVSVARRAGKHVFFHSDGWIADIIPDLIEIGVDSLNSQLFCMDLEDLGRRFRGRITFWGEIDRQRLLSQAEPSEVAAAVREVHRRLSACGGVIAQCEFGIGARPENVEAVFRTWSEIDTEGIR
jgi:uroporphyrinogen decarboxylase